MSGLLAPFRDVVLLAPEALGLALLIPLALWRRATGRAPALDLAPKALFGPGAHAWNGGGATRPLRSLRTRTRFVPAMLQALGLLALVVTLARPARPEVLPARTVGVDLLLALDVSSSMTETDLDPSRTRLEVAKDAALAFVAARPDDRIGLLVFARYPDLACPPTRDHDALARILRAVATVPDDGPEDATGIGLAVARGTQVLSRRAAASPVLVLLTDGEENVALKGVEGAVPPAHAAQLARRLGVRVTTIAVGRGRRDPEGAWRALDTTAVRRLAERTGGTFHAARDADALAAVYAEIDRLEKAPLDEPRTALVERTVPWLLAALVLLLLGRVADATVWRVLP